jgi:flagellin-like protein
VRPTPFFFSLIHNKGSRKRSGISPVIATTILLGITVALGLALWSFANAGVGTATQQYAETVTDYGKFASDRFVVPSVAYDYADGGVSANDMTVYVYNSGRFETQIVSAIVTCRDCTPAFGVITLDEDDMNPNGSTQANESTDGTIASRELRHIDFDSSSVGANFVAGFTYQIQVVSETGAYQTIYQKY